MIKNNKGRKGKEFSTTTKRNLGERVAYMCSNPLCRRLTIKPKSSNNSAVRQGKASHIHSAAENGPRWKKLSDEFLKSFENGIWLCDICAREVDDNESKYKTQELLFWKKTAESYVGELVTQDTRLRQLRSMVNEVLTNLRILNALPHNFDTTFQGRNGILVTRVLIETEQVLFENEFFSEAAIINSIYRELETKISTSIRKLPDSTFLNISESKNSMIKRIMIEIMRYSLKSYNKYLETETEMVDERIKEIERASQSIRNLQ